MIILIDANAVDLYIEMIKSSLDTIAAINKYINYEEAIADGLTGLAYILFEENVSFSFSGGILICNGYRIKEIREGREVHLVAEKDGRIIKDYPFGIYEVIK